MKIVKYFVFAIILFIIFVIGLDLLFSDYGQGETEGDRQVVFVGYLLTSGVLLYFLNKVFKNI